MSESGCAASLSCVVFEGVQPVVPAYTVRNSLKEKDADGEKKEEKEEKKERERNNSAHQKPRYRGGERGAGRRVYNTPRRGSLKITIQGKK